jgi:hypothetical protein
MNEDLYDKFKEWQKLEGSIAKSEPKIKGDWNSQQEDLIGLQ